MPSFDDDDDDDDNDDDDYYYYWLVYLVFASLHTPLFSYKHGLWCPSPQNVATLLLVHCLEHFSLLYSRHYFHRKSKMQGKKYNISAFWW